MGDRLWLPPAGLGWLRDGISQLEFTLYARQLSNQKFQLCGKQISMLPN